MDLWCRTDDYDGTSDTSASFGLPILECHGAENRKRRQKLLDSLSTAARFRRFAHDFLLELRENCRRDSHAKVDFQELGARSIDGTRGEMFRLPLRSACEFLSKMTYTDNWSSELNEEFAFWSEPQWRTELEDAGWTVVPGSHAYCSEWQVQHRWEGRVALFHAESDARCQWPPTNMVMAGERPDS